MVHIRSKKFSCKSEIKHKELVLIYIFHSIYNTNFSKMLYIILSEINLRNQN